MTSVKTAISLQEALFEQAEIIAKEMKISRSRLFNLALEDFVLRYRNRELLKQINEAYTDLPDSEERDRRLKMLRIQKRLMDSEWE